MKTRVATIDRFESRPMPQIPCPEVQPEPSCVPTPTRTPAVAGLPPLVPVLPDLVGRDRPLRLIVAKAVQESDRKSVV